MGNVGRRGRFARHRRWRFVLLESPRREHEWEEYVTHGSADHTFERFVRQLDYTMYVITTRTDAGPAGCLVGFAGEVSIRPPRFLAGLSIRNHTFRVAQHASYLAVHTVSRRDIGLVELFGGRTGDLVEKFDLCDWHAGPYGMPILDDAAGWFVGRIHQRFVLGDHVGHLLAPVVGQVPHPDDPLVSLSDVRDLPPGHEA